MTVYAGSRLQTIENTIKTLFNDDSGRFFTHAQFVAMANAIKKEVAQRKIFRDEGAIDSVAGTWEYDISTALSNFVTIHSCRWITGWEPMVHCDSMAEFDQIRIDQTSSWEWMYPDEGPRFWYVQGSTLSVWPAPESTTTGGIIIRYSYEPDDFDVSDWHSTTLYPVWTADTLTEIGTKIQATTWDGYLEECTARSGDFKTSPTTEPTWSSASVDGTTTDDAVTWTKRLKVPNYTPANIASFDSMYIDGILTKLWTRKGRAPEARAMRLEHGAKYEAAVIKALSAARGPTGGIVPYR